MTRESDRQSEAESRRIIDRVSREAEAGGRPPAGGHGPDENDWIDEWGTRIGRILGVLIVIGLVIYLGLLISRGG